MHASRTRDILWLLLFPPVLTGVTLSLLPGLMPVQLAFLPIWVGYWLMSRNAVSGAVAAVWVGILLEWAWGVPPGACSLFFLIVWRGIRLWRRHLPERVCALHGLLGGTVGVPAFALWLWLYGLLWPSGGVWPTLPQLIFAPAAGALMGGAVFTLAARWDFRVIQSDIREVMGDED